MAHAGGISGAEVPRRGSGGWHYVFPDWDLSTDPRSWCKRSATAIRRHHWPIEIASRLLLKTTGVGASLAQRIYRVVPYLKRLAKTRHQCRRYPLRAPSGRCLNRTLRSGRCGDWIWYMRGPLRRARAGTRSVRGGCKLTALGEVL